MTEVRPAPAERAAREPFRATLRASLAAPGLAALLVASGLLAEVHQTVTVFLNQLQYERCGMTSTAIGAVYIVTSLLGLCGAFSARFTGAAGPRRAVRLLCLAPALGCLVLMATDRAALSVGCVWLLRVSDSLFQPYRLRLQNAMVRTGNRATALSIHAMVVDTVSIVTNLAFGALAEWDLRAALGFGAVAAVTALLLLERVRRRTGLQGEG